MNTEEKIDKILEQNEKILNSIEEFKIKLKNLDKIYKNVVEIKDIAIAPRAISMGNGLIMAKLSFSNLMLIVQQEDRLIGPHIIMNGIYEKAVTKYVQKNIDTITTFIDIGANIGYYTCMIAKHLRDRGQVYAFEPSNNNYKLLINNLQINWLDKENIITEKLALGSENGIMKLYNNIIKPGNTSLLKPKEKKDDFEIYIEEVKVTTMDEYFMDKNIEIDLIKIDVEGYEFDVLKGAEKIFRDNKRIKLILEWDPKRWRQVGYKPNQIASW